MNNKKRRKILIIVLIAILVVAIALGTALYFVGRSMKMPEVGINYAQTFEYPDFVKNGTVVGTNAKELFFSFNPDEYDWCYMGKMEGYCEFSGSEKIDNSGVEIVKKKDDKFYSYCQTSSTGKMPIFGDININSAKRSYADNGELYCCQIDDNKDYQDGNINWQNATFAKAANPENDLNNLKAAIPFLARENTVTASDPNVYSLNGHSYVTLDIDATKFSVDEFLDILGSKLSSQVMDLGKKLFNLTNAKLDLSELDVKMIVEFTQDNQSKPVITGRDCIMKGAAKLNSIFSLSLNIDMSMSAVISYDSTYFDITSSDLLNQFNS